MCVTPGRKRLGRKGEDEARLVHERKQQEASLSLSPSLMTG